MGCENCSIRKYHESTGQRKTKREKMLDQILTDACNGCKDGSNFYDRELNDLVIEKISLKLKVQRLEGTR
jgi:hypothetical protein